MRTDAPVCIYGQGGGSEEAPSLLSYTLRYVSLAELGTVCRVGLREPMNLCAYMDRGEDAEEAPSLLSYTLRYVSLAELGTVRCTEKKKNLLTSPFAGFILKNQPLPDFFFLQGRSPACSTVPRESCGHETQNIYYFSLYIAPE